MQGAILFNWRDYVKLEKLYQGYYDSYGRVKPNMVDRERSDREALRKIEQVMDQISHIPEVQEYLRAASKNAEMRFQQVHDMYGDSIPEDKRITIGLSRSPTQPADFRAGENRLHISPGALSSALFPVQGGGVAASSLQAATIHEFYHAADQSVSPLGDLIDKKNVAKDVIDKLLTDFPEFKNEYEDKGTIAGYQMRVLLGVKTFDEFEKAKNKISNGHKVGMGALDLEKQNLAAALLVRSDPNDPEDAKKFIVSNYFQLSFEKAYNSITEARYEIPAVNATNAIMAKFFPNEPQRDGYGLAGSRPGSYPDNLSGPFQNAVHSVPDPAARLSPTSQCNVPLPDVANCPVLTISR